MLQIEQILTEGDLDLERNREVLKTIRNGEWTFEQVEEWFQVKEKSLESVYAESKLPYSANEENIKRLMLECMEQHYGSLSAAVSLDKNVETLLSELDQILSRYR